MHLTLKNILFGSLLLIFVAIAASTQYPDAVADTSDATSSERVTLDDLQVMMSSLPDHEFAADESSFLIKDVETMAGCQGFPPCDVQYACGPGAACELTRWTRTCWASPYYCSPWQETSQCCF